jgi:hypothetical protein
VIEGRNAVTLAILATPVQRVPPALRPAKGCQGLAHPMLYTIAVVLIVPWLLGLITSYTMGGFIHVLLVIATVMILIQVIQGRRS